MGHGIVHHLVDLLLVNNILAGSVLYHGPPHAAVTQQGDLVAGDVIDPRLHFTRALAGTAGGGAAARKCTGCNGTGCGGLQECPSCYLVFHGSVLD